MSHSGERSSGPRPYWTRGGGHNGIIENYLLLKKKLIEEGHKFTTETDTEAIAHLVEKYFLKTGNGHHTALVEAVRKTEEN
jgi:glucosamine--fructose-6-phosphate aminotransferase (isomerizing)